MSTKAYFEMGQSIDLDYATRPNVSRLTSVLKTWKTERANPAVDGIWTGKLFLYLRPSGIPLLHVAFSYADIS